MSQLGPFAAFSPDELVKFNAIAKAQDADDTATVKALASQLSSHEKARFNEFADICAALNEQKDQAQAKIAHHQAQISSAQQDVAYHQQAASQKMAAYAPGYKAQVDASMQKGGAATNGNGARHAAQPEKVKKKGSCTIL